MNLTIISAVTTEPITVAEAEEHLRLDTTTFSGNISVEVSIAGGYHSITASYGLEGTAISVDGYNAVVSVIPAAVSTGGTIDLKIQESDTATGTFTDYTGGGFTQITTSNATTVQEIGYAGTLEYIRVVATVTSAEGSFAANVVKYSPYNESDTYIEALITASRAYAEAHQKRALATQQWRLTLDDFPDKDYIELPFPPLQSVDSIVYIDKDGTSTTMTVTTDYTVDTYKTPGRIDLAYGTNWPTTTLQPGSGLIITFTCGYTASATLPKPTKQGMLLMIGDMHNNRETAEKVKNSTVDMLLDVDKVFNL